VNGQYQGVYINVERIDRSFLERNFGADEGILFKVDEGGPGADLRYLGPDSGVYTRAFELHAGEKREASRRLLELLKAVNGVRDAGAAPQEVSTILDTDAFLTTTAVMLFAGAFDQYTGWGPHNYYLYRDPSNGRWTYIPWDLDVGFADRAFDRVPVIEGWNAAWPAPVPERPLMEWLVTHDDALKAYRAKASVILETRFRPDIVLPKLQALHRLIADDLARDPFPPVRITNPTDRGYADILTSMETFIRKRYTLARAQLDNPGARPRNDDGPRPGPDSADAPAGLRAVRVTSSSVELSWTDRANGEVAVVLQRANSADSDDFVNTIGQPGENITTAIDRDVRPGRVYRYRVYAVFPTSQGPRGSGVSNTITVTIPDR
jgi:hypothetical protein